MRLNHVLFASCLILVSACSPAIIPLANPTSTTALQPVTPTPIPPTRTVPAPTGTPTQPATPTTIPPTLTVSAPTNTPISSAAATLTELPYTACGWVWATQDLPQVSDQLVKLVQDAGMTGVGASASAYGENCLDQTGKVNHFAAMETDFNLVVPVTDTKDTKALGDWIVKLLPVIGKIPADQLAGPNPGRVSIQFKGTADEVNLSFPRQKGEQLLQQGLSGSALFDALKNNP